VHEWVTSIGLDPAKFGTHSLKRTKAVLIYRRTGNLRGRGASASGWPKGWQKLKFGPKIRESPVKQHNCGHAKNGENDIGGAEGNRTPDLCSAIAALSHLSYGPG
jgi:hypothetical protein